MRWDFELITLTSVDLGLHLFTISESLAGNRNDILNGFVSCVNIITTIVDPNGTLKKETDILYYGYLFENQTTTVVLPDWSIEQQVTLSPIVQVNLAPDGYVLLLNRT